MLIKSIVAVQSNSVIAILKVFIEHIPSGKLLRNANVINKFTSIQLNQFFEY